MIDTEGLRQSILEKIKSNSENCFIQRDVPTDYPLFTIEDEEKVTTARIKGIDESGNAICEQRVEFKEPITKMYIRGEIKADERGVKNGRE